MLGNIVNDGVHKGGIPTPVTTSLLLLGNLSLDIGSEVVPKALLEFTLVFLRKRTGL